MSNDDVYLPPLSSSRHLPSLDGLRAVAVMMVLMFHAKELLGRWASQGYLGVTLFFVLSGFLITGILIDTRSGTKYFRSFYFRRAVRIFPVYYGALAVLFLLVPLIAPAAPLPPRHDWPFYLIYLNNWTSLLKEGNNWYFTGHFWSLAVEEQFYLVWPLIVFLVPARHLSRAILAGTIISLATGFYLGSLGIATERNTICNAPPLMLGAYCAIVMRDSEKRAFIAKRGKWFFVLSLLLMAEFLVSRIHTLRGPALDEISSLSVITAFGLLLLSAIDGPSWLVRLLSFEPLRRIGKYSYGMYVYHIAIFTAFAWLLPRFHLLRGVVEILAAIAVAALSYELFEKRINRLKRHVESRRDASRAVAA